MSNIVISSNKDKRIYSILQRFDLSVIFRKYVLEDKNTKCWNWIGPKTSSGYGYTKIANKEICYSHRLAYMLYKGIIPLRYQIDHLCKNKLCCNPEHLEAITPHENKVRSGFITKHHKSLKIDYFKKEIEQQDQDYKDSLVKEDKKKYHRKKVNDVVIMRSFNSIFT